MGMGVRGKELGMAERREDGGRKRVERHRAVVGGGLGAKCMSTIASNQKFDK